MKNRLQNDHDIIGFMTKIQEQLAVLDQKLDTFMTKSLTELAQAKSAPRIVSQPQPQAASGNVRQPENRDRRPMFRAICADCKKECEIPFKPTGNRPVYCKECFARRKTGNALKITPDPKLQEGPVVPAGYKPAITQSEPLVKAKKKTVVAKKKVIAKGKAKKKK